LVRAAPLALAAAFFCAVAPTLHWTEFHDSVENLNVATALEMRRGGPWLVPNLQGVPRLAKPPLTAWVTAVAIRPSTLRLLSVRDSALRTAAYDRLAFEVRWPALAAMCLTLAAVYQLGRVLGGPHDGEVMGLVAALACGSSLLFLRYARLTTTDCMLALWVAVANWMLARAVLQRRYWSGCLGAGAALGLAVMSKGPVALVQTVLPFAAFLAYAWWARRAGQPPHPDGTAAGRAELLPVRPPGGPVIAGALVMLAVGGWWFLLVALRHERMASYWRAEITRVGADDVPPGKWYQHFASLHLFIPWLAWLAAGAWAAADDLRRRRVTAAVLALGLLAWPLVVMSLAKDRFPRYLPPLAPAGSLLVACAIVRAIRGGGTSRAPPMLMTLHWLLLGALVISVPLVAASGRSRSMLTEHGRPWFSIGAAVAMSAAAAAAVALGLALRRRPVACCLLTAAVMLAGSAVYAHGHGRSITGRSEFRPVAELIRERWPDAELLAEHGARQNVVNVHANALSIHMNREVRVVADVAGLPPGPRPQIWVASRAKHAPEMPTPAGWEVIARITSGGEKKYLLLREPAAQRPPPPHGSGARDQLPSRPTASPGAAALAGAPSRRRACCFCRRTSRRTKTLHRGRQS
jgi:4-amino-4-deoxy-L-arabinose transferase-like glycosyltransferase